MSKSYNILYDFKEKDKRISFYHLFFPPITYYKVIASVAFCELFFWPLNQIKIFSSLNFLYTKNYKIKIAKFFYSFFGKNKWIMFKFFYILIKKCNLVLSLCTNYIYSSMSMHFEFEQKCFVKSNSFFKSNILD